MGGDGTVSETTVEDHYTEHIQKLTRPGVGGVLE